MWLNIFITIHLLVYQISIKHSLMLGYKTHKVHLLLYHICIEHSLMQGHRTHKVHMYIWTHWTFLSNIPNISHLSHSYYMCTLLHPSLTLIMWWKIKIQAICAKVHRVSTCRQPQSEHKLRIAFNSVFYLTLISGEEHNYQAPHNANFSSLLLLNMLTNKQTLNSPFYFIYSHLF